MYKPRDHILVIFGASVKNTSSTAFCTRLVLCPRFLRIAVTPEYIEKCMPDHDVDNVINNLNSSEIRDYFYFDFQLSSTMLVTCLDMGLSRYIGHGHSLAR